VKVLDLAKIKESKFWKDFVDYVDAHAEEWTKEREE